MKAELEAAPRRVDIIHDASKEHSLCVVDAVQLDDETLRMARQFATGYLSITKVEELVCGFPHHIGGGWPMVHPEDNFVMYGQITEVGHPFEGVSAMSRGGNIKKRTQALAVALVLAAVVHERLSIPEPEPPWSDLIAEALAARDRALGQAVPGDDSSRDDEPAAKERKRRKVRKVQEMQQSLSEMQQRVGEMQQSLAEMHHEMKQKVAKMQQKVAEMQKSVTQLVQS